jgi:hypothetical protein
MSVLLGEEVDEPSPTQCVQPSLEAVSIAVRRLGMSFRFTFEGTGGQVHLAFAGLIRARIVSPEHVLSRSARRGAVGVGPCQIKVERPCLHTTHSSER